MRIPYSSRRVGKRTGFGRGNSGSRFFFTCAWRSIAAIEIPAAVSAAGSAIRLVTEGSLISGLPTSIVGSTGENAVVVGATDFGACGSGAKIGSGVNAGG